MRRIVAAIGRSLISLGVLLLLFVAYQLWGTGIAYSKAQNQAKKDFLERMGKRGEPSGAVVDEFSADQLGAFALPTDTNVAAVPTSTRPTSTRPTSTLPDTIPLSVETVPLGPVASTVPTVPPVTVTTLPKVRSGRTKMLRPAPGHVLGRFVIPRIKKDLGFVEGAGVEDLKSGPGHYAKTPLPGEEGNVGIACHRTTYGAPCFNLNLLKPGDPIFFETDYGKFRYEVETHYLVGPKDKKVLAPVTGESILTITTCHPQYSAAQRYVIRARLVGPAVDADLYFEPEPVITAPPTTIPRSTTTAAAVAVEGTSEEDPTVDDTSVSTSTSDSSNGNSSLGAGSNGDGVDTTVGDTVAGSLVDPTGVESERPGTGKIITFGWFSGRASFWTSTLVWMVMCALIWIVAWLIARRRRVIGQALIYGIGFIVVFLPALYFCFENLAHLLPENV
jgi:sortase A